MLFNSLRFLFGFLPIVWLVFWRLRSKRQRHVWLTVSGYVFYGFWDWRFCGLMAFSTLVSYAAGRALLRTEDERQRKLLVAVPVTIDLALLGFFKYTNFALSVVGVHAFDIVLPVGISFYTFHTITYIVDCYRRAVVPTRDFFEFSCYVSLFAQLVAGPIVRFRQIEKDLETIESAERHAGWHVGWSFFAIGLAKKVLLADTIAAVIDPALAAGTPGTASAWLCMLGYTYQLYFDFSGYSDMAVGLGHLFGLRLPQNFASPYKATDPSDFWKRWHISLSTVLRDYLYIPLGGSRGGSAGTARNLMITMLLGGLWHGANWTFVVWGGYHGLLLVLHRFAGERLWEKLPALAQRAGTFLLVVVGWVFFRAPTLGGAGHLLAAMFTPRAGALPPCAGTLAAAIAVAAALAHLAPNTFEIEHARPATPSAKHVLRAVALGVLTAAALVRIYSGAETPFLYFQF